MISNYFTDEITIVKNSFDLNGVPTFSETTGIKAKVEDYNKMLRDVNGQEVIGGMIIFACTDANIDYEDSIKISKKNGVAYDLNNKKFSILKLENVDGFLKSHKEIII